VHPQQQTDTSGQEWTGLLQVNGIAHCGQPQLWIASSNLPMIFPAAVGTEADQRAILSGRLRAVDALRYWPSLQRIRCHRLRRASTHNSTSVRSASKSSKGRNCPRCNDCGKTQDLRNSSGRHRTSSLGCKLERCGLIVWRCKLGRYCRAADDSRARSHNHASERRAAFQDRARRTQRLAAATRKLQLIRRICATFVTNRRAPASRKYRDLVAQSRIPLALAA
jgi:hypothetical protein